MVIAFVVLYVMSIVVTIVIARRRNGNVVFWTALAVTIGPLAIPFLVFIRNPKIGGNAAK